MSNPPEGWYPDPTGQPNTIRWWNGKQWTNRTQQEDLAATGPADPNPPSPPRPPPSPSTHRPANRSSSPPWSGPARGSSPTVRRGPRGGRSRDRRSQATPRTRAGGNNKPRPSYGPTPSQPSRLVGRTCPRSDSPRTPPAQPTPRQPLTRIPTDEDGLTPFERARATWNAPVIAPAPPEHWTQREAVPLDDPAETATQDQPKSWTLKLAPPPVDHNPTDTPATEPTPNATGSAAVEAVEASDAVAGDNAPSGGNAAAEPAAAGGTAADGLTAVGGTAARNGLTAVGGTTAKGGPAAGGADTSDGASAESQAQGWSDVSWTGAPNATQQPQQASQPEGQQPWAAQPDADEPTQIQPTWGAQPDDQHDPQTSQPTAHPAMGT